ncbi:HAD domain-containing protein [Silvimonas sp.]|uniref:HAD domain-containing protein n=1 Tax=Silvimonas sp. TaxID=2650811 RepID=UPI00284BBD57|nr:HAD domain-containing protein [Silvimonas sp.]MDR3426110.1 HAD domain-containing protein [Silvimonas sp.]
MSASTTVETQAPSILYLDYDGPLHPYSVYQTSTGPELRADGQLFMHAHVLEQTLNAFQQSVHIILATNWVVLLGFDEARARLPTSLQQRVAGATWEPGLEEYDAITWRRLPRYEQIARHTQRHGICHWLAIDDDNDCWPDDQMKHLVLCDRMKGLGLPDAVADLKQKLHQLSYK